MKHALGAATLAVVVLAACAPSGAGTGRQVLRSPDQVPFGTQGLSGIPPRPSYPPQQRGSSVPQAQPATWVTRAEALSATATVVLQVPPDAVTLQPDFFAAAGLSCAALSRAVLTDDGDAFLATVRSALAAAGYHLRLADQRPLGDAHLHAVLLTETSSIRASVEAGKFDPAEWPDARALGVSRAHVVRVLFAQRCGERS